MKRPDLPKMADAMLKKNADMEMPPADEPVLSLPNSDTPEPKNPEEPLIQTNAGALWDMMEVEF